MTTQSTADMDIPRTGTVPTSNGELKVHTLKFRGFKQILAKIQESNLQLPPAALSLEWLGLHASGAEEAERIAAKNQAERSAAVMRWLSTVPEMIPVVVSAVTSLNAEQVDDLDVPDIAVIIGKAISLIDVERTTEMINSFFPRAGGLTAGLSKMFQATQGKAPSSAGEADTQPATE